VALRNPHGLAQDGDYLYFIDYESKLVVIVGKDDLESAGYNANVRVRTIDLSDPDNGDLLPDAKGQAIIALNKKIYALYLRTDAQATVHYDGVLLRLDINNDGSLAYRVQTTVGKNPQSIIPVNDGTKVQLLIPAIGGRQFYDGSTNGTESNICVVEAEAAAWPDANNKAIVVTGDVYTAPSPPEPPAPTAYDIHAIGAAMRDGNSQVFILTHVYTNNAKGSSWRLYQTSVTELLKLLAETGAPVTLTKATTLASVEFEVVDQSSVTSPDVQFPYGIYFWDILYEQTTKATDDGDRLWLVLGSPFLVTKAEAYGSPTTVVGNPYVMLSGFGGVNVNSVDLLIETLHQAQRDVSLKRGVRGSKIALGMGRAATATTAMSAEEGEAEEDK
jgi:hypothetical protein